MTDNIYEIKIEEINDEVVSDVDLVTSDGTTLGSPVTESHMLAFFSVEEVEEQKIKYKDQQKISSISNGRERRVKALSYLATKADLADPALYDALMGSGEMQNIFDRWKDTGNTLNAINTINGLQGDVVAALDTVVGEKDRSIRDYVFYTLADATNDLELLKSMDASQSL